MYEENVRLRTKSEVPVPYGGLAPPPTIPDVFVKPTQKKGQKVLMMFIESRYTQSLTLRFDSFIYPKGKATKTSKSPEI